MGRLAIMAGTHSWERKRSFWAESVDTAHDDLGDFWPEWSDSEDDTPTEPMTPGSRLVHALVFHILVSNRTAKAGLTLLYWAGKAGIAEAKKYMINPDSSIGHFSRKFKAAVGHTEKRRDLYEADCAQYDTFSMSRVVSPLLLLPAHEQVAADLEEDAGARLKLSHARRNGELPPAYWTHPVVRGARDDELVMPFALFVDGVGYSLVDAVIGFWLVNLISGARFLFAVLRKKTICRCGCKGWCVCIAFSRSLCGR